MEPNYQFIDEVLRQNKKKYDYVKTRTALMARINAKFYKEEI